MLAADPDPTPVRTDRRACAYCEATPRGCASNQWLRGRWCCDACAGDHDAEELTHARHVS